MKRFDRRVLCTLLTGLLAAHAVVATAREPQLQSQDLVYGYDEMFEFDTARWLREHAPHLQDHAEVISHWAGFSGISPRVLLALMQAQSGVLDAAPSAAALERPFGTLVPATGFDAQVRETAQSLRDALYDGADPGTRGPVRLSTGNPLQVLAASNAGVATAGAASINEQFQSTYRTLFGGPRTATIDRHLATPQAVVPPRDLLEFPYPRNARWHVGGAHTNSGSGSFPMSSLDMSVGGWWGSDQSRNWVSASAAGRFVRHSSCMAEVVHAGGWSTTYYHMSNLRFATGAEVASNTPIGNPANNRSQALCNGGMSTGPHEHWSLKSNGSQHHLNGVTLSGYLITATGSSYDTNCARFNLQSRDGKRYCSGNYTNFGPGEP